MHNNVVKILGIAASIVGAVASLLGSWASEKKQDAQITEKVGEAISKLSNKN